MGGWVDLDGWIHGWMVGGINGLWVGPWKDGVMVGVTSVGRCI